ncbi:MAG: hypothetical protein GXY83_44170, partial [Rhodopirellula sp.]|nr:hypothetical protein [Rhodopirellula sp.]
MTLTTVSLTLLLAAATTDGQTLRWDADAQGQLTVRRQGNPTVWQGSELAVVVWWDANGRQQTQIVSAKGGWTIERQAMGGGCRLDCRNRQAAISFQVVFSAQDDVLTVSVPASRVVEAGEARLKSLR